MRRRENKRSQQLLGLAKNIKLLVLDVDGVLTDGGIVLDDRGNEIKTFHVRDGHGITMLIQAGISVAFVTGRQSAVVERRARELGVSDVFQKSYDKTIAVRELMRKYSVREAEVAYIGDDIVDIPVLKRVGFPVAVADAEEEVKAVALYVTEKGGGRGAVREFCDFLLKAKGMWKDLTSGDA